jgi:hypothetical protein
MVEAKVPQETNDTPAPLKYLTDAEIDVAYREWAIAHQSDDTRKKYAWWERRHPYLKMFIGMGVRVVFVLTVFMLGVVIASYLGLTIPS